MASAKKETHGYWSGNMAAKSGYYMYNSVQGPLKVTIITDNPPDKFLKGPGRKDIKYICKVTTR